MAAFIEQHTAVPSSLGPLTLPASSSSSSAKTTANMDMPSTSKLNKKCKKKKSRPLVDLFPTKVFKMLNGVEELGLTSAVSWLPHGRAFIIKDKGLFINTVVPKFFKATKIRSFQRQLHLWSFKRIHSGSNIGAWWHPSFVRGRPEDLKLFVRTQIKGKNKLTNTNERPDVPNFYEDAPNFYEPDAHETESNFDKVESNRVSDTKATADGSELSSECSSPMIQEEFEHLDQEFEESMFAIQSHSPRTIDAALFPQAMLNTSRLPCGPFGSDGRDLSYNASPKSSWGGGRDLRIGNKMIPNIFNSEQSSFSGRQHDIGSGNFSNFASQVQVNDDAYDEFSAFIDRTIQLP